MLSLTRISIVVLSISHVLAVDSSSGDSSELTILAGTILGDKGAVADTRRLTTTSTSVTVSSTSIASNATCPSGTINYITHTLPQQCLRTDWVAKGSNVTSSTTVRGDAVSNASNPASSLQTPTPPPGRSGSALSEFSTSSLTVAGGQLNVTDGPGIKYDQPSAEDTKSRSASIAGTNGTDNSTSSVLVSEAETDSPLDTVNFLSFEEWKKQNLEKVGQSPENVGQARAPNGGLRKRPGSPVALDTLGEDSEIELDFGGFGAPSLTSEQASSQPANSPASEHSNAPASLSLRSRDAGKTCKERTNYASFDCSATVLKSNPECKSASSVLVENQDSYMLNKCSAKNKFFIVELCNDILIDTIVLANYEFFSSMFRTFRLSVSDRYPVKLDRWRVLGSYEARNTREVQAFLVEEPQIWARYLRIEFLTHYGNEYYCPVSLLRVHGTTMMEEFRHQEESARGENLDEDVEAEVVEAEERAILPEPIRSPETIVSHDKSDTASDDNETSLLRNTTVASVESTHPQTSNSTTSSQSAQERSPNWWATNVHSGLISAEPAGLTCQPTSDAHTSSLKATNATAPSSASNSAVPQSMESGASDTVLPTPGPVEAATPASNTSAANSFEPAIPVPSVSTTSNVTSIVPSAIAAANSSAITQERNSSSLPLMSASNAFGAPALSDNEATQDKPPTVTSKVSGELFEPAKQATSTLATAHAQPSTQESFFKSVHKRLQALESNATLSLQYIESQSLILRDAFAKVEKRQLVRTSDFLDTLNTTVMSELHGFRQAYDQLWQSTVLELEGHRERYEREMLALSTRLTLLADELAWQKKMGIVQSVMLLLCLGLVLFARAGNGSLDVPRVQQVVQRSQSVPMNAPYDSPPRSPSPDQSPVGMRRRSLWRRAAQVTAIGRLSDESRDTSRSRSKDGPDMRLQPPTPESQDAQSETGEEGKIEGLVREEQSGPATRSGTPESIDKATDWPGDSARTYSPPRFE